MYLFSSEKRHSTVAEPFWELLKLNRQGKHVAGAAAEAAGAKWAAE